MDNVTIRRAETRDDAGLLESLAERIWTQHYTPIIGPEQVEYMLRNFQSADKIYSDMAEGGYIYYIACCGSEAAGYCAVRPDSEAGGLFLSKLYVDSGFRRRGVAKQFLSLITELAQKKGLSYIWLTVNKNNSGSIEAYKSLEFKIADAVVTDIGGGFVMDDYVMKLEIQ